MGFDFTGIKANLEGIKKYLNANGVNLSANESKQLESIFTQTDIDKNLHANCESDKGNNLIDHSEVPFFINLLETKLPNIAEKTASFFVDLNDSVNEGFQKLLDEGERHIKKLEKKALEAQPDAIKSTKPNYIPEKKKSNKAIIAKASVSAKVTNNKMNYSRSDILEIAVDQAIKRMPELKHINPASKRIDIAKRKYPQAYNKALKKANTVTDMVIKNCKKYDVSDLTPVIMTMLGVETGGFNFSSRVMTNPKSQFKGVMQTNLDAIKALYNDNKSRDVKFVKELKSKYKTPAALYTAIQSDVELGLQVGILFLKTKIRGAGGNVARGVKSYCGDQYKYDYPLEVPSTVTL